MPYDAATLDQSTDMTPVAGTVDVAIPAADLWACFNHADWWPRWNPCMFWVNNHDLQLDHQLVWAFEPIRWWYIYKLFGIAKIVELEPGRRVTWEVTALPGFYARHTYSVEDLGGGKARFGSWEKAMGPLFRLLKFFWVAHFVFVKDRSLEGASYLESVFQRAGHLTLADLPARPHRSTVLLAVVLLVVVVAVVLLLKR